MSWLSYCWCASLTTNLDSVDAKCHAEVASRATGVLPVLDNRLDVSQAALELDAFVICWGALTVARVDVAW